MVLLKSHTIFGKCKMYVERIAVRERWEGGGVADKSKESRYFFQYVYVLSRTQVFLHLTKRFHFAPFYLIKFDLIGH
jgi:hypothetical protein